MVSTVGTCYPLWLRRLQQAGVAAAGFELDLLLEGSCSISKAQRLAHPEQELCPGKNSADTIMALPEGSGRAVAISAGLVGVLWTAFCRRPRCADSPRGHRNFGGAGAERIGEHSFSPDCGSMCRKRLYRPTVACERPDAEVALLELSPKAGEYCKKNILSLAPQCCFVQADVLKNTAGLANMDAVLSNPPYIPSGDLPELQREVQHEPSLALDGADDGLRFYREIPFLWKKVLKPGGLLAFEIGFHQAQAVCALMRSAGFDSVRVVQDYGGNDRVVLGRKAK
ncbi:MAG: hypothetical protein V8T62_02450 [Oscillospiraceae bacterium]